VDDEGQIRAVGRSRPGGGHGASGAGGSRQQEPDVPPIRRRLDEVVLTGPHRATLHLLRQRILEHTRRELDLPRHGAAGVEFAASEATGAGAFVGRLLSDQNLLAAARRGTWPPARIDAALEHGMTDGLAETLEVLHDVGELDAATWQLVCAVLEELQRKVCSVGGAPPDPPAGAG
jgi:hypothetical protein